jgi:AraC-type DNA-binding domain-containing proteins
MLLYLSLLGFLLSGLLLFYNYKKYPSSVYLALFFLLVSLYRLNEYVVLYSKSVFWNAVVSSNFVFLSYLIGPLLFFYVRSVVCEKNKLSKNDLLHFVPAILFFLALIPYIVTPFGYKMEIAKKIVEDTSFLASFKPTIISDIFSVRAVYFSRPASILGYSIYSIFLFISCLKKRENEVPVNKIVKRWLVILLIVTLVSFLVHWWALIYMFGNESTVLFIEGELMLKMAWLSFTILVVSPLLFPRILYGIDIKLISSEEKKSNIADSRVGAEKANVNVDEDYYKHIGFVINEYLTDKKSFLKPGYNLTQLADETQLQLHHLTYFFREIKKQNFTDYKNELRVRYACELILSDEYNDMTLEAIGEKAGFSSRVTFIRAFKKVMNQTPGNYKSSRTPDLQQF